MSIRFRQQLDAGGFRLIGLPTTPTGGSDAVAKSYCDGKVNKAGDSMQGTLNMGANKITLTSAPTASTDAANKSYVDSAVAGRLLVVSTTTVNYGPGGEDVVIANGSSITITLPPAGSAGSGKVFRIKNIHSTLATLNVTSGGTIDGSTSVAIRQNEAFTVVSDGTNWYIV